MAGRARGGSLPSVVMVVEGDVRLLGAGFQRLSYCADCEVIKGRAQTRGFSVAQVQDAFEMNGVLQLFGELYSFMVGGTRFDTGGGGAAPGDALPAVAAEPMHGAHL